MSAFLLLWKEAEWDYENIRVLAEDCKRDGFARAKWRIRASKIAKKGDRVFVLKQLPEPSGIFGVGALLGNPKEMDDPTSKSGPRSRAEVEFDILADPKIDGIIVSRQVLKTFLRTSLINSRASGQTPFLDEEERKLRRLVDESDFVKSVNAKPMIALYPDEACEPGSFLEGAKTEVLVNRFERDRLARQACLRHYGYNCSVCSFNFLERYGSIAGEFIHIHHLTPIHEPGLEHRVDPIEDLRPVCPNCHAVIHRKEPPYGIDELRDLIERHKKNSYGN